jgi:predicted O-methyltransferase YrrM
MTTQFDPTINNPVLISPVAPEIEAYLEKLCAAAPQNAVAVEMEVLAKEQNFPIVGRLVGLSLLVLARSIGAKRVFEFGSGYGYSAYWFAQAIGAKGQVICTDGNADNAKLAQDYLSRANLLERIDFRVGLAQTVFGETEGLFDICYNDVDKGDYPQVWQLARSRIRPGGLYIADNVLWHGRVAMEYYEDIAPGWTAAILEHNRLIFNDPEFDAFINPIRDGVIVARRKMADEM